MDAEFASDLSHTEQAMLLIPRKMGESIIIGDNIIITVIEIRGDTVRLGIELPAEVPVHKREIYDAVQREETASQRPR